MNQSNYDYLKNKYPELFERASSTYFSISDGWLGIIDTLFGLLSKDLRRVQQDLDNLKERIASGNTPSYPGAPTVESLTVQLEQEKEMIPTIRQIKEKFGGLRIYMDVKKDSHREYIDFAESMSYHVCEVCGAPGVPRRTGWIKVLCDEHHLENITGLNR